MPPPASGVPVPSGDDGDWTPVPDPLRRAPNAPAERGRGATFNIGNRFRREAREACDDGWGQASPLADETGDMAGDMAVETGPPKQKTIVTIQRARTIISRNASPDIPFTQSINPYQVITPA
ncbi:MAG: hypothetical protein U1F48_12535 [Burkholderiales bacterium]